LEPHKNKTKTKGEPRCSRMVSSESPCYL